MNKILTLLSFLTTFFPLSAQPFMFKHLEVADGLSNNSVYAILKDKDGFMWFGTGAGLNRYDGYTFKVYRRLGDDPHSLPDDYVKEIKEVGEYLWIRMEGGYVVFDKAKDSFVTDLGGFMQELGSHGNPECVYVDPEGNTWISVAGEGLYCYAEGRGSRFFSFSGHRLQDAGVNAIGQCSEGIVFLYDSGIFACINPEDMSLKWVNDDIARTLPPGKSFYFSVFVDREDCAWIYSVTGLWVYDASSGKWRDDLAKPWQNLTDFVHTVAQDGKGRIWIGKDYGGIDVFDKRTGKILAVKHDEGNPRSLSHNTVYQLYSDRDGLMWVGTYKKGICRYGESMFKFDMYELGDITSVEQADAERLWLGTNDSGLLLWNFRTAKVEKHYALDSYPVVSLLKAGDGSLWVGTFNGGLYRMKNGDISRFTAEKDGLAGNNVWDLKEDGEGRVWIGCLDNGLQYFSSKDNAFHTCGKMNDFITSLCLCGDDYLVIGTYGIAVLDLRTMELDYVEDEALDKNGINQVYCDSRGLIWIATRGGLKMYDPERREMKDFSKVTDTEGEVISGVTEDLNHSMWISSTRRMIHLNVSGKGNGTYRFESRLYNDKDGLQNCDFNQRAIRTLDNGWVVAGGFYGLNIFNPDEIRYNKISPEVMFSRLFLFNEEIEVGKKYRNRVILPEQLNDIRRVEFEHGENIFSIGLSSDNFSLPEKTRFVYRLEGLNDKWISLTMGANKLTFTNLSAGKYILDVKAVNNDGYESHETARLEIVVHPPFWLSWWACLCYFLFVISSMLFGYRHILKREREKFHMRQVEQEAARKDEINQMKFRFFTNISHELRTPLTLIITPLEGLLRETKGGARRNVLELMYRNAWRLLVLVNQLLDFRKGEMSGHYLSLSEGDIVSYVREVCNSFLLMAVKKRIQFSFFSGVESFSMAFDADKVGKVVMNLLSNAFKYTPEGGRVTVILEHVEGESDILEIRVSDTGTGIPDAEKEHIFERFYQMEHKGAEEATGSGIGLSLVRDFVHLHDGTVSVFDNIGTGTVFVVHLPVRHVDNPAELPEPPVVAVDDKDVRGKMLEKTDRNTFPVLLVVDDNEDFRTYMRHSLELQYRVKLASGGEEAWKMIQENHPDLVISDVMMPGMDGNELCRLIKSDNRTAHIPVILLTARHAMESKVKSLKTGADDYVTKPFNMIVLVLRIRKLIELSRYRQATHAAIDPTPSEIVITSLDEKLIERAVKYVEDNISRSGLSVEELSRELGMSRVHLYKKLLQITGKTPIEFIRVIRLKRAAQLLRESQLHVSEVAYEVGFNNPKYFSRYFKEEFGVLPSVYQEKEGK